MLYMDYTVVDLVEAVLHIPAGTGEFTNVPSLKVSAGREYDIGEFGQPML